MNMFAVTSKNGEPRRAQLLTAAIAECGILLANVDYIAPIITMSVSSSHVPHRGPVATPLVHPTPPLDALPGVWSQLPDPSAFYAMTRMPYSRMAYSPAPAGRMTPAPITVTARAAVTTTVTSSVAVSAVQAGRMDPQFAGPRAPIPGAYVVRPGYALADHQYHLGPAFEDPSGVGMYGYPGTGYAEVGAVGGVPDLSLIHISEPTRPY